MRTALVSLAVLVVVAAACGSESGARPLAAPTPIPCGVAVPAYPVLRDPPRYRLDVRIPARGLVRGTETISFRAPRTTSRIVLRLWANSPATRAAGARLTAKLTKLPLGARREATRDTTTLAIRLARPLRREEQAVVGLRFSLGLPNGQGIYRVARGSDFVRLGSFFPILALDAGGSWATDPPSILAAETSVSPSADFDVRLQVPAGWTVLATGVPQGGGSWHAAAVRDFAVAAGRFVRRSVTVLAPKQVVVTAVAHDGQIAAVFADRAANALRELARHYGPYPWPRFGVAATDDLGRSGIEYPNLVFEGTGALDRATAHEVAHQWFYSLVGNNQARDPWLDEALASWAMTRVDPATAGIRTTPLPPQVQGKLTAPMAYWDTVPQDYFAGVYAQGVAAFDSLGDPPRVDCALRLYAAREAYGIARVQDLVNALAALFPPDALRRFGAFG